MHVQSRFSNLAQAALRNPTAIEQAPCQLVHRLERGAQDRVISPCDVDLRKQGPVNRCPSAAVLLVRLYIETCRITDAFFRDARDARRDH